MSTPHSLVTFTPSEAEEISGLSTRMQRDWRQRGFLPTVEGHARFNAFEVADMRVMKLLADGGLGPASSRLWKRAVAYCVVSRALQSYQAYTGAPKAPEVLREKILREAIGDEGVYTGEHLPAGASRMILRAPRFAVWWGGEGLSVGDSLDELHKARMHPGRPTVPAIFLDIHGAASDLLRLAGYLVLTDR